MPMNDPAYKGYPEKHLTLREWNNLLEYSASLPTGTTPGKQWKAHLGHRTPGGGVWWHAEYGAVDEKTNTIAIIWSKPVIRARVKAISRPVLNFPYGYPNG